MDLRGRVAVVCLVALLGATDSHAQKLNPKAKLVEPERGERRFVAPASIPLEAEVQAAAGRSIVRVEFFVEATLIGEATAVPYAVNWSNVPIGEYRLRVRATDSQGATDWSPYVRVRVLENRDPRVRLIEPGQDAQFSSPASILLRAQARDRDHNLVRVEFYADGALIGTSTTEPYSLSWGPVPSGDHVLLAKAIDALGATDESRPIRIRVTGNNTPVVSLASPANGALFNAPGPITITANATDADGNLARVDFFVGETLIGTATTAPFTITWTDNAPGTHTLSAQAIDTLGAAARSAPVSIIVNAPPTVALTSPASGAIVQAPGNIVLNATAADADGTVSKVDFYQGTALIGTDTTSPYSFTVSELPSGTHSFTAVATDERGVATTSVGVTIIANGGPTITLTSPSSGTVVQTPGSFVLSADAADSDGKVTKVDFYQGATLLGTAATAPYSFPVSNLISGVYNFTATATDDRGATTTSAARSVIVNASPLASLTSPAPSAVFTAPANIPISADAADSDGTISSVEFYFGTTLIATRTNPPFSIVWTGVPQGTYSLSARALDNNGGIVTSGAVNITVNSGVAKLYFIHVDHLNTPRLIADDQQRTVWRWDQQEPFGANVPDENPLGLGIFEFPLRFQGQYADRETALSYNVARDYWPDGGRYIQSDPLGLDGGINTYVYASLNPLSLIDPDGLLGRAPGTFGTGGTSYQTNGNVWGASSLQTGGCDFPMVNLNKCVSNCCNAHDNCYTRYKCNWSSWFGNMFGTTFKCQRCNTAAVGCIMQGISQCTIPPCIPPSPQYIAP